MKNAVRTYGRKRIWAIIVALMATLLPATAQDYRFEAGGGLGISGYLGDVNQSNVLKNPGFSGELLFRYLINKRFALKTSLATASISGNSADFKNVYPNNAQYAFDAQYYDAAVAFEFNFMNFGMLVRFGCILFQLLGICREHPDKRGCEIQIDEPLEPRAGNACKNDAWRQNRRALGLVQREKLFYEKYRLVSYTDGFDFLRIWRNLQDMPLCRIIV